jgi:hypothetical protein
VALQHGSDFNVPTQSVEARRRESWLWHPPRKAASTQLTRLVGGGVPIHPELLVIIEEKNCGRFSHADPKQVQFPPAPSILPQRQPHCSMSSGFLTIIPEAARPQPWAFRTPDFYPGKGNPPSSRRRLIACRRPMPSATESAPQPRPATKCGRSRSGWRSWIERNRRIAIRSRRCRVS